MDNKADTLYQNDEYDIIIAGAGCAGLSLLHSILQSTVLNTLKILVIDKSFEKSNDRTWCFWEINNGKFDALVCKKWEQISVHKKPFSTVLSTAPFVYKMIQGQDFYKHIISFAKQFSNVHWQEAVISSIDAINEKAVVQWEGGAAKGKKVFSSILPIDQLYAISQSKSDKAFLWQHFKGLLVQFEQDTFDDNIARLMDFNVDQKKATAFMYVLPLDRQKALVEYTLFSKSILKPADYDKELKDYLNDKYPNRNYQILHEEMGAIPMTTQPFASSKPPIYVIGTLGNAVKASTGYAFQFIQAQVNEIVTNLALDKPIDTEVQVNRHQFYDAVLLYILDGDLMEGSEIFKRIFEKNKVATIFKFLSNTSTIWEDIQIMRSLPTKIFLPAAIKVLFRRG